MGVPAQSANEDLARVRRIHFFQLSRAMQERFISSARGTAPPAPILQRRGATKAQFVFAGIGALGLAFLLFMAIYGFGVLGKAASVQPYSNLVGYAIVIFLLVFGALRAVGSILEARALPFPPGVYVFPMCLVDARTKRLAVAPMTDLQKVEPATKDAPFRLTYKGAGTFQFPPGAEPPDQLKFQFEVAQEQAKHAQETGDEAELVTLDPFYEPKKFVAPIGPQEPLVERIPPWAKFGWAIAVVAAGALGPTIFVVRNRESDDATLARAKEDGSPDAFRAYLSVGRRHKEDVESILLPRAELEVAKKQGTVEGIQAFIANHPGSAIDGEAQNALHDAYVAELEKVKAKGTVSALEDFTKKYPQSKLDADIASARHALYASVLAKLKKAAPGLDENGLAFWDKLFAQLEKNGPKVVVVLRREISPNLERADKLIGASPLNKTLGPKQVTKYFADAPNPKEAEVAKALQATLGKIVPADMLRVEAGPTPPADQDDAAVLAATKAPLLVVRYRIGWFGAAFSSNQLKRAFAGVNVTGDASFYLPNDARTLKTKIDVWPPRGLLTKYESEAHPAFNTTGPSEEDNPEPAIYGTQEMRALDLVTLTLERMLLPPGK